MRKVIDRFLLLDKVIDNIRLHFRKLAKVRRNNCMHNLDSGIGLCKLLNGKLALMVSNG